MLSNLHELQPSALNMKRIKSRKAMNSEILIYQNKDGDIKIDVRLEEETVWLTQDQMSSLFGKAKSTINEHVKNIYEERELEEAITMKKFGNSEFQQKAPNYYNLDVIISVGYRVKSPQGTQFRIWATILND
jgi:Virulence protein